MRRARLSHCVASEDGGARGQARPGTIDAGIGRSCRPLRRLVGKVLRPSSSEVPMSAVLVRLLFPATCASSLSWRLALSAATRREETLVALRGARVSA
jgi:hypothetical protein